MDGPSVQRILTADRGDGGRRVDLVLRRHLTDAVGATRTRVQSWIAQGRVTINGTTVRRVATRTMIGDVVSIALPATAEPTVMGPEDLPIDVLYEDDFLLALDKPAGIVVHPTYGHPAHTLMNALLWRSRDWPNGQRPSIVGRLDKQTSGLVLVAKSAAMHAALQRQLGAASSEKDYLAVVYGCVPRQGGIIDLRLGRDRDDRRRVVASKDVGAESLTRFTRIATTDLDGGSLSLLSCRLVTGRMHQIRVHLAASGWPIVGDQKYGEPRWGGLRAPGVAARLEAFPRQALHAWRLSVMHPVTGRPLRIESPVPTDIRVLLDATFSAEDLRALAPSALDGESLAGQVGPQAIAPVAL